MKKFKVGDRVRVPMAWKGTVIYVSNIEDILEVRLDDTSLVGKWSVILETSQVKKLKPKNKPFFKSDITKGYPTLAFKEIEKHIKNGSESSYGLHFSLDILRKAVEEWESGR